MFYNLGASAGAPRQSTVLARRVTDGCDYERLRVGYSEDKLMKKEFTVERDGKTFVLYAGLLDMAHERGLKAVTTTLVQIPNELNGNVAICHATVETEQGTFTGLGDASPGNVNRMMSPHLIRMAETRAKARALRDAVNVGVTALEELADVDDLGDDDQRLAAAS